MKGFKKGIALIAVLAFLIAASMPMSVLATASTTPKIIYGDGATGTGTATMEITSGDGTVAAANATLESALNVDADITTRFAWAGNTVNFWAAKPGDATDGGSWYCAWVAVPGTTSGTVDTITDWAAKAAAALAKTEPVSKTTLVANGLRVPSDSAGTALNGTQGGWYLAAVYQNPDGTYVSPDEQMLVIPCVAKPKTIGGGAGVTGTTADSTTFQMQITSWDVLGLNGTDNTPADISGVGGSGAGPSVLPSSDGAWLPTAPPVNASTNFDWSWTGPDSSSGTTTATGMAATLTVPEEGSYTITCKPAANNAPWIIDGEASTTITVGEGSDTAGPAAKPTAIAIGQKAVLTATVPYEPGTYYGWASKPDATAPNLPINGMLNPANYPAAPSPFNYIPEDGKIVNEAWPVSDTWYQLTYGTQTQGVEVTSPQPKVSVAQLYAVDQQNPAAPTSGTVEIVAKAGSSVTLDAVWGNTGTYTTAAPAPDVDLTLYENDQQIVRDASISNTVTLRPDQRNEANFVLSYEADKPTDGVCQLVAGVAANGNNPQPWPYSGSGKSDVDTGLQAAWYQPKAATFKVTPAYLLGSTGVSGAQGKTEVSISGGKLYSSSSIPMCVQYSQPVTYPGQNVIDGSVEWELIGKPGPNGVVQAGPQDQRLILSPTTTFEPSGKSWGNMLPEAMGTYVVRATAILEDGTRGSQVTFNVDVNVPADPNSILIMPGAGGSVTIPAGDSKEFTASVVNASGLGLTGDTPTGVWTMTDDTGLPLYNDQVTLEGADTAQVTVTPDKNAVGAVWQLRFTPDDKSIQSTRIRIRVTQANPVVSITLPADPGQAGSTEPEVLVTIDQRTGATMGIVTLPELTGLPAGATANLQIQTNGTQAGQTLVYEPAEASGTLTYDAANKCWLAAGSSTPIKQVQLTGFNAPVKVTVTANGVTLASPDGSSASGSSTLEYKRGLLSLPGDITPVA